MQFLPPPPPLSLQAASASMETHTMARYVAEHSLQEYQFMDIKPSLMAAASMYLALRMKKLGGWVSRILWHKLVLQLSRNQPLSPSLPTSLPPALPPDPYITALCWIHCRPTATSGGEAQFYA